MRNSLKRWGMALVASGALFLVPVAGASAATVTQLQAQVSAYMPTATSQVQAAKAAGPAAFQAFAQKVNAMSMPAPNTTSVQQYADIQALVQAGAFTSTGGASKGSAPVVSSASASNYCWYVGNHIYDPVNFYEAGVWVGEFEKDHGYWCGNGYSITDAGGANLGFYHKESTATFTPYCQVTVFNQDGWDAPHYAWAHAAMTNHFGSYTPWTTCVTWMGNTSALRIAANGYHDKVNDF